MLTGDGGDDVYLGYPFFNYALTGGESGAKHSLNHWLRCCALRRNLLPDTGRSKRLRSAMSYATGGIGSWMQRHDGLPYLQSHGMLGERSLPELRYDWREIPAIGCFGTAPVP